jgi:outer membrane immunogenic protein
MNFLNLITSLIFISLSSQALAKSVSDDLDSLGVNRDVVRKARGLNPNNKVKVVQKRAVDRTWRVEGSLGYGFLTGGDPYVDSRQAEGALEVHVTPRFSLGGRYYSYSNDLSSEGKRVFNQQTGVVPDVRDFAKDAYQASVSYYPIYGKINLFNWNVTQFDVYLSAAYGKIQLQQSGSSDLMSVSGGVGFWFTNWLTSRFEIRYQTYKDVINDDQVRKLNQTVFSAKIGFLL